MASLDRYYFFNDLTSRISEKLEKETYESKQKKKVKAKKNKRPYNIGDIIVYDASGCNRVGKIIDYGSYKNQYYIRDYHDETDTKFINERNIIEVIPEMLATDPRLSQYLNTPKPKKSVDELLDNIKQNLEKISAGCTTNEDLTTYPVGNICESVSKIVANTYADIDTGYINAEAVKDDRGKTVAQNFDETNNKIEKHSQDIYRINHDIEALYTSVNKTKNMKLRQQLVNYYTNIGLICSLL